ncbi:MAG: beta-galactosidase trimerization domain-containing protein [Spirochaetaceae bacterium]|nr:beta-galactosidase trimerization domain-containing protein [Spirochaetaceae bacterium]
MKHFDPWDTRFAFFWYNDQEIFHDTDADLARKAEAFAEVGINHVITFSATHFRWSFLRHWDLLTDTLARVVAACHAAGIRVTEHHSSHLTHNPLDVAGERRVEQWLRRRGSSIASWPHLREDWDAAPVIDGVPLPTWRQVDGRTGKWARSAYPGRYDYQGWAFCFNNPHYRRAYLAYLETLYATGIDGIMTDDVEWFGAGHACACAVCRGLFREQTGHDLPEPGTAWERWHGDHGDPSYVAWLRFRTSSTTAFHQAVADHYRGLGIRPLRPNYSERVLHRDPHGISLEDLPDLDWIFKENDYSTIVRYSWSAWAIEAAHRFAVGRWRGIPPMSMFYPDRPDTVRFCWALAMSWGHLYLATPEGRSLERAEKRLRRFEVAHPGLLRRVRRVASLGFYDSRPTRALYEHAEERSLAGLIAWTQACYRRNVPFDLFQPDELARLPLYRVVVLNDAAFLGDAELAALRGFVQAGGTLVWTGATGSRDETGAARDARALGRCWEIASFAAVPDGAPPVTARIGAGRLVLVAGDYALEPVEGIARPEDGGREARVPWQPVSAAQERQRDELVAFLCGLAGGADLETEDLPAGVLATVFVTERPETVACGSAFGPSPPFATESVGLPAGAANPTDSERGDSLVVHLVNAAQTLAVPEGGSIGHDDPIPFPRFAGGPARITLRTPEALAGRSVRQARYHDPDVAAARPVAAVAAAGRVTVTLDPSWIGAYGLVQIELD